MDRPNNPYLGCSYEDFPHSEAKAEGMHVLQAHVDERSCRTWTDIPYRTVDGQDLHLDIIVPTYAHKTDLRWPLILFVQGSGWQKQHIGRELVQLARLAQKGYVVAIVEYRHSAWAPFPAQVIDAKWARMFMMEHADQYFVDVDRVVVMGDSSGGHTALMSILTRGMERFLEPGLAEGAVSCLVDFYGVIDVTTMADEPITHPTLEEGSNEWMFLGGRNAPEGIAEQTIVTRYVSPERDIPPTIIFHGSKDRIVPFGQSVKLYNALKAAGKRAELYQVWGADHGDDPFWNHEILGLVDQFIQSSFAARNEGSAQSSC